DAEADRAFLRDVLRLPNVDVGGGWLIFALPASEVAVHPADDAKHELYLMCPDIAAFVEAMTRHGIECGPINHQRWGVVTHLMLPGGGRLGVYEPRHARPKQYPARKSPKAATRRGAKGSPSSSLVRPSANKSARKKAKRRR